MLLMFIAIKHNSSHFCNDLFERVSLMQVYAPLDVDLSQRLDEHFHSGPSLNV